LNAGFAFFNHVRWPDSMFPMSVVVSIFMVAQGFGRAEMSFTFRSGFYIGRD